MKYFDRIKNVLKNTKSSYQRFPLVMASAIILAVLLMVTTKLHSANEDIKVLSRYSYTFFFAMFNFLFFKLLLDSLNYRYNNSIIIKRGVYIASVLIVILVHFFVSNQLGISALGKKEDYFFCGIIAFYTVGAFFIGKIYNYKDFQPYVVKILFAGLISNIYSVVLYMGIAAIYFSLTSLFGISISNNTYLYTAYTIFIPYNVGIFLSNFPNTTDNYEDYILAKSFRVLLEFILTPILIIYTIILFAYFAKIIFTRSLPNNIITNLVLWYGVISVGNITFLSWIKDEKIGKYFNKIFPIAVLPLLAMMFYAIILRVNQYGFTENRYYVAALGLWVTISMVYLAFSKEKVKIVLAVVMAIIILATSMGPLSAYKISAYSQNKRFKKILIKNSMLANSKIIPNSSISEEDKKQIIDIVNYMKNNHKKWELKNLPEDFADTSFEKTFGFSPDDSVVTSENLNYFQEGNIGFEIAGYNKMFKVEFYSDNMKFNEYTMYKRDGYIVVTKASGKNGELELVKINMEDLKSKLEVLKKENANIRPEDLTIYGEVSGVKYKIIFTELSFNTGSDSINSHYGSFYFLVNDSALIQSRRLK